MIFDILFPNRCIECNKIIESKDVVCESCFDKIEFTHWEYKENNPLKQKVKLLFPAENAFALMHFSEKSLTRKLIHQLKYAGKYKMGYHLAKWTTEKLDIGGNPPDLIVSTPLHHNKLKKRGFNQTHIFTEEISKNFNIPFSHDLLTKKSDNTSQAKKDKHGREETRYNFQLSENIQNQHVLIVDDIFTTGNTMSSMAWKILENETNKVSILVMAMD